MIPFDPSISIEVINQLCIDKYSSGIDIPIYHYTSFDAIKKIIEKNTIIGTELDFSNDKREIEYSVSLLEEFNSKNPIHKDIINKSISNIKSSKYRSNIYISCFSKVPDDLTQWKSKYGDNGKGVCFKINKLRLLSELPAPIQIYDIIYNREQQMELLFMLFNCLYSKIDYLKSNKVNYNSISNLITKHLFYIITLFKEHSWHTEQETRVVSVSNDCDWFNPFEGKTDLGKPFTLFPLVNRDGSLIEEIIIGPCSNNFKDDEDIIRSVISNSVHKTVKIKKSKSPLRC